MSAGIVQKSLSDGSAKAKRIWFTSMDASDPQAPLSGSLTFTVRFLKSDGTSVAGGGTITQPDSTNAAGVRYYTPSSGDLSQEGVNCVVIGADGMIRREVPFDIQDRNPYNAYSGGYLALPDVAAGGGEGALITAISSADRAGNNGSGSELFLDGEGDPEPGQGTMDLERYKTETLRAFGVLAHGLISSPTSNTVTLDTDAPAVADVLVGSTLSLETARQPRRVIAYTAGRVATVFPPYTTTPTAGDGYVVRESSGHITSIADLAIAVATLSLGLQKGLGILHSSVLGTSSSPGTSIVLGAGASSSDDVYNGKNFVIGDENVSITDYVGSSKTATVSPALVGTYLTGAAYAVIAHLAGGDATLANQTTLLSRLSSARAGYLDNLNVGGLVASSAEATAIQNNTRVVRVVPERIVVPETGTETYKIRLYLYDSVGNMEAPDAAPTIGLANQAGTSRSARLSNTTMTSTGTGVYEVTYTSTAGDADEQLLWTFSVVEGGVTRSYGNTSLVGEAEDPSSIVAAIVAAMDAAEHRPGRSFLGLKRRLDGVDSGAASFPVSGVGTAGWAKPGGDPSNPADCEVRAVIDVPNGTRGEADVSVSEAT